MPQESPDLQANIDTFRANIFTKLDQNLAWVFPISADHTSAHTILASYKKLVDSLSRVREKCAAVPGLDVEEFLRSVYDRIAQKKCDYVVHQLKLCTDQWSDLKSVPSDHQVADLERITELFRLLGEDVQTVQVWREYAVQARIEAAGTRMETDEVMDESDEPDLSRYVTNLALEIMTVIQSPIEQRAALRRFQVQVASLRHPHAQRAESLLSDFLRLKIERLRAMEQREIEFGRSSVNLEQDFGVLLDMYEKLSGTSDAASRMAERRTGTWGTVNAISSASESPAVVQSAPVEGPNLNETQFSPRSALLDE